MLPQHLTGTMNEQLFLFLLEEKTVAVSCSQDRYKQQRFGTEEMSPCGQISCLPLQRMCLKKGPCFSITYGVQFTTSAEEPMFVSMTQTPTENCGAVSQKAI